MKKQSPVAWRYRLIGEGQILDSCFEEEPEAAPYGTPGIHYSEDFIVEQTPLYEGVEKFVISDEMVLAALCSLESGESIKEALESAFAIYTGGAQS